LLVTEQVVSVLCCIQNISNIGCSSSCASVFAASLRAQDNPLNDSDLKEMLKQAQEMQKKANPTSADTKKKLAEMLSQAKEEVRQAQEEKRKKEKLQAALKKQVEAPGPVALPDWTRATPQFKAGAAPTRKIVEDERDQNWT